MTYRTPFQAISWKFLALLIPIVTVSAIAALAIYAHIRLQASEAFLQEKIETILQVHNQAVAHPLGTLDYAGLERSLQTIALYPEISCVEVLEIDESSHYEWPKECSTSVNDHKTKARELLFFNQPVGRLVLFYTSAPYTEALRREVKTGAWFFFLLVCVASVVAFTALHMIVGRPVRRLISSIRKAEQKDVREPVAWSSQDELGSVISAYNKMIQQVDGNTAELVAAREQAESADRMKSRFLAIMSHELRTPLNAVIGITEMLREEAEEDQLDTEPYERIAGSGRHLLHLIDDILDFSKIEADKITLLVEETDLSLLLGDVIATTEPLAARQNNQLILDYSGTPEYIMTDWFRLKQIVLNMMSNACKFTHSGVVSLKVAEVNSAGVPGVQFTVSDTGIGIPLEKQGHLFMEFSQADDSTTRQYGGTGLGLAISQRLCKLLGGEVTFTSKEGEGSEFSFVLPCILEKNPTSDLKPNTENVSVGDRITSDA